METVAQLQLVKPGSKVQVPAMVEDEQGCLAWRDREDGAGVVISVSIVRQAHGAMVEKLIRALLDCPEVRQVILTRNVP